MHKFRKLPKYLIFFKIEPIEAISKQNQIGAIRVIGVAYLTEYHLNLVVISIVHITNWITLYTVILAYTPISELNLDMKKRF